MKTYRIYPWVKLGQGAEIGDYVLIGVLPKGMKSSQHKTIVGAKAWVRSHTVIYAGTQIGDRFRTGHGVLIREDSQIGDDVSIGSGSVIEHHVKIGNRVRLHSQCFIPEFTVLGDDCWIGPRVVMTNALFPRSRVVKERLKGPLIESGAKVGANATLLPGIVIGRNALIGAGSVVTKDVPPYKVAVGNPAKIQKDVRELTYKNGQAPYPP